MHGHITQVHKDNIVKYRFSPMSKKLRFFRVPHADKGRDSIDLNIFGMQGVPRQMIEERILAGAA